MKRSRSGCQGERTVPAELTHLLERLATRGLIPRHAKVRMLTGNLDRAPEQARWHCLIDSVGGLTLKLTLGADLREPHTRSTAFSRALPGLCPREVLFERESAFDVWAAEAVSGTTLEQLPEDGASAARFLSALDAVEAKLAVTAGPTDDVAFAAEWRTITDATLALRCWSEREREFLRLAALPALAARLRPLCPSRQWSNGDFISSNVCLTPHDRVVLFDAEYATATHFHVEDRVRFRRISPICHRHPGLVAGWWSALDSGWEVFFQLRQLGLENAANSPAYLARVTPERKAAIRFFAESWLANFPAEWPPPLEPPPLFVAETAQLTWRTPDGAAGRDGQLAVAYPVGSQQFVGFRLPAGAAGVTLHPALGGRHAEVIAAHPVMPLSTAAGHFAPCPIAPAASPDGVSLTLPPEACGVVMTLHCN